LVTVDCYRHDWGKLHGNWKLTLSPWPLITDRTTVLASASEYEDYDRNGYPSDFTGDARITIHNVSPRKGEVTVWLEVNWGSALPIRIDYVVINR
jgi:hypothetical protein